MVFAVVFSALLFCAAGAVASGLSGRAVVIQNKGGGHGTLGYSLCKQLKAQHPGLSVTLLQDTCNRKKEPFASYGELEGLGVSIVEGDVGECAAKLSSAGDKFDYVVDNWSKTEANAATVIGLAKASAAKQLLFVSSGGMYKGGGVMPCTEESEVKLNDARKVELAVVASDLPHTFVRPQYIYGPKSNKRYLDFFLGRVHRAVPIPLPLHGEQLLSLTHIDDAAALVALAVGHPAALNQVFNCASDRFVTYRGLCEALHDANATPAEKRKYLYYEPKDFDQWDGSTVQEFPFRRETFVVAPSKAKLLLGFRPTHSLVQDLAEELAEYKKGKGGGGGGGGGANSSAAPARPPNLPPPLPPRPPPPLSLSPSLRLSLSPALPLAVAYGADRWGLDELRYDLEIIASQDERFAFSYAFLDDLAPAV